MHKFWDGLGDLAQTPCQALLILTPPLGHNTAQGLSKYINSLYMSIMQLSTGTQVVTTENWHDSDNHTGQNTHASQHTSVQE